MTRVDFLLETEARSGCSACAMPFGSPSRQYSLMQTNSSCRPCRDLSVRLRTSGFARARLQARPSIEDLWFAARTLFDLRWYQVLTPKVFFCFALEHFGCLRTKHQPRILRVAEKDSAAILGFPCGDSREFSHGWFQTSPFGPIL